MEIERKIFNSAKIAKFPTMFIKSTDEPRIQSAPSLIFYFKGNPYYASLKYDGTSATYLINPETKEFMICSRNLSLEYNEKSDYSIIANKYDIKKKLKERYAIQCEIYGPKIGKNNLKSKDLKMAVFTIKDLIENRYLDLDEMDKFCKENELPMVEIIERGDKFDYDVKQLIEKAKGFYPGTEIPREGLVFRLTNNWFKNGRYSFKIINNDYLLMQDSNVKKKKK